MTTSTACRSTTRLVHRDEFINWARNAVAPLSTLKPGPPWGDLVPVLGMIGDATVVALSEGVHCAAEPLEFRNRLLQCLVREKNFTTIAIESGLVESRIVHDYVRGGPGDIDTVLDQGFSWTFDRLPQNRALVQWLRNYNADRGHGRKVNFYGFDVPGSPGNSDANRGIETALVEALKYVALVDETAENGFRARLEPLMGRMRFNLQRCSEHEGYEELSQAERDALTATVVDIISLLERREAKYTAITSAHDYAWAYRAAVGARQIDAWLRHIPLGWQPRRNVAGSHDESLSFFWTATDVRDCAQADNLDWILRQEGPEAKVLMFASRFHLSSTSVKVSASVDGQTHEQEVAGTFLRRRLGERLVTIGNLIGQGEKGNGDYRETLGRAPSHSMDGLGADIGTPLFLLDLRSATGPAADWLNQEQCFVAGSPILKISPAKAYDILFYIDAVSPARV